MNILQEIENIDNPEELDEILTAIYKKKRANTGISASITSVKSNDGE